MTLLPHSNTSASVVNLNLWFRKPLAHHLLSSAILSILQYARERTGSLRVSLAMSFAVIGKISNCDKLNKLAIFASASVPESGNGNLDRLSAFPCSVVDLY